MSERQAHPLKGRILAGSSASSTTSLPFRPSTKVSSAESDSEDSVDTDSSGSDMTDSSTSGDETVLKLPTLATQAKFLRGVTSKDVTRLRQEECETAPLFSADVFEHTPADVFRQYGLLAAELADDNETQEIPGAVSKPPSDNRIFLNVSAPWSAFICGSQGSGKSHSLSCILENCLVSNPQLGHLASPLTGIVFHYDRFTSYGSNQVCEAAYLCSSGIPVTVLVSPTNLMAMKEAYENLPGLPKGSPKPQVVPMQFMDKQLNIDRMMKMMAVSDSDGPPPLYIEVIHRILREMATSTQGQRGFDYKQFRRLLEAENLLPGQTVMMKMRLDLLESFLHPSVLPKPAKKTRNGDSLHTSWAFRPGALTIVDLSCPFVDAGSACALFNICLGIFLEARRGLAGCVVALDEAHKFLTRSQAAADFTDELLGVIRQQRHLGARVVIATQEPTLSDKLLDLCSFTLVHRFASPAWFAALRGHLAGIGGGEHAGDDRAREAARVFDQIVRLVTGEGLLFCPAAMLRTEAVAGVQGVPRKLGGTHLRVRVRARLTADGGRSIMAG